MRAQRAFDLQGVCKFRTINVHSAISHGIDRSCSFPHQCFLSILILNHDGDVLSRHQCFQKRENNRTRRWLCSALLNLCQGKSPHSIQKGERTLISCLYDLYSGFLYQIQYSMWRKLSVSSPKARVRRACPLSGRHFHKLAF